MLINNIAKAEGGSIDCALLPVCFGCPFVDIDQSESQVYGMDSVVVRQVTIFCKHAPVCANYQRMDQPDVSMLVKEYVKRERETPSR